MSEVVKPPKSVRVEYVKGKYAYKQRKNVLSEYPFHIEISGHIETLKSSSFIDSLYKKYRDSYRLDKISRDALKGLQMNLYNPKSIESKGITHIIIYECLQK